ncbi:hypothetical protein F5890DRAFT_1478473 [Lentinula detonsa]|uniref:Uncharacterized protein n=1 Tax=Lentinula detonsa TaxID=2804962 RepID=A0AA38UPV6_9AGAR|nr:hypothetical protein F5890DRAFT_1478473 [Lentinula detonsa]
MTHHLQALFPSSVCGGENDYLFIHVIPGVLVRDSLLVLSLQIDKPSRGFQGDAPCLSAACLWYNHLKKAFSEALRMEGGREQEVPRNLDIWTETYNIGFYLRYLSHWPNLCCVQEAPSGRMMGYGSIRLVMGNAEGRGLSVYRRAREYYGKLGVEKGGRDEENAFANAFGSELTCNLQCTALHMTNCDRVPAVTLTEIFLHHRRSVANAEAGLQELSGGQKRLVGPVRFRWNNPLSLVWSMPPFRIPRAMAAAYASNGTTSLSAPLEHVHV